MDDTDLIWREKMTAVVKARHARKAQRIADLAALRELEGDLHTYEAL